jgi:hypothetical protein
VSDALEQAPTKAGALVLLAQELVEQKLGLRPEVVIRVRPNGSVWTGCQCEEFVIATGDDLESALNALVQVVMTALPVSRALETP